MKSYKLFLLIPVILILSVKVFGQPAVNIPFSVTEGIFTKEFAVGLDINATNCIDTLLGECIGEPPIPPPGVFFSSLIYPSECEQEFACKDYRPPGNPPAFPFTGMVQHTLWFQVSSPGLPLNITYNLPVGTQMYITDLIGGSFLNLGPFSGQGVATIPGSYTVIFSKALLILEYNNIVPVELTSFTSSILQNEKAVQLNWTTATETNNSGFEILRGVYPANGGTQNDSEWETIGFVSGFGTATEPKAYSFIDENITNGTYKYRLKQIDFDGTFDYSNEIEVEVDFTPKEFVLYQNYPNPFNPKTVISYQFPVTGNVTLKVYDILGNEVATLVNEEKQSGVYEVEFDAATLAGRVSAKGGYASGVYFYQLIAKGPETSSGQSLVRTKKMVLLK